MVHSKRYRARLPHSAIVRGPGLLPMLYSPSELAQELDVPTDTLRGWLRHDAPHQRDEAGRLWVNGRELAAWIEMKRTTRARPALEDSQAYCFSCRRAVTVVKPVRRQHGRHTSLQGECSVCGRTVNRGMRHGQ